jgi:hypothetical protein
MFVRLANSTIAEIIQEHRFLLHTPRWDVRGRSLVLGTYNDGYEHENHVINETVGSTTWFDEFRFDINNFVLTSTYFRVPEENIDLENLSKSLMKSNRLTGLLRLTNPEYFEPKPTRFRWFDPEGKFLFCVNENALSETSQNSFRLRIATDVDLMFENNLFSGWILSNPLHYVTKGWDQPRPTESSREVASIAYQYLQLVSEDFLEQMEDENPDVLQALLNVRQQSVKSKDTGYQRAVFNECIESIIDQFYGDLLSKK